MNKEIESDSDSSEIIPALIEWTRQVTVLATGTLVLSATFISDILKGEILHKGVLVWAWILLTISSVSGVLFIGCVCTLFSSKYKGKRSIYSPGPRATALLHIITFIFGLILFVYFASTNFLCSVG